MFQNIMKYLLPLAVLGLIAYAAYDSFFRADPTRVSQEVYESGESMPMGKALKDYQYYVADIIWEKQEITGGGAFPTDTIVHMVEDAYVDVWAPKSPDVDFFTANAPAPGPGYRCVAIQKKRYWGKRK